VTATNTPHIPANTHQTDAAEDPSTSSAPATQDAESAPDASPEVAASPAPDIVPVIAPSIQPTSTPSTIQPNIPPKPSRSDSAPPRIIAMMNQKGGVGKTTTCTNLGAGLSRMGKRVLMMDLDPQAHLSLSLGIDPDQTEKSMYDLLGDSQTTADQVVQQVGDDKLLTILPAEVNLAGIEAELADKVVTGAAQAVLKQKVASLIQGSAGSPAPDYVLIDCPPSLGLLTVNALTLASEVIVPMQAHFLALQGLGKLFETIAMMKQGINPSLTVAGVVLCMHEGNTILANEVINDVNSFLTSARGTDAPWSDAVVFNPPIRRNIKLAESPSFGQSIFDYAPECHGAKDYAKLAESVATQSVRQ
jgi:chromosome partitioning protein